MALIMTKYKELLEAYKPEQERIPLEANESILHKWRRPTHGVVKVNTDLAMRNNVSFLVVVARNERGNVILVHNFKQEVSIPEMAESEATQKAIHIASSFGWRNVCLEMNTQAIIKRDRRGFHQAANLIFDDIISFCTNFNNISFVWAHKKANRLVYIVG